MGFVVLEDWSEAFVAPVQKSVWYSQCICAEKNVFLSLLYCFLTHRCHPMAMGRREHMMSEISEKKHREVS